MSSCRHFRVFFCRLSTNSGQEEVFDHIVYTVVPRAKTSGTIGYVSLAL